MNELYFFVRKLGLDKEVVTLSLVVTESISGRWNEIHDTIDVKNVFLRFLFRARFLRFNVFLFCQRFLF